MEEVALFVTGHCLQDLVVGERSLLCELSVTFVLLPKTRPGINQFWQGQKNGQIWSVAPKLNYYHLLDFTAGKPRRLRKVSLGGDRICGT